MARFFTAVILILIGFSIGCGGECIRHSDCQHKEICVAGSCTIDTGDAGSNTAVDSDTQNPEDAGVVLGDSGQDHGTDDTDSNDPKDEIDGGGQPQDDAGAD